MADTKNFFQNFGRELLIQSEGSSLKKEDHADWFLHDIVIFGYDCIFEAISSE